MEFFDRVSQTLSDAGQKTREAADIAGLNRNISGNEKQISQLYAQLGEAYYNAHGDDPEPDFEEVIDNIKDLESQIEEWNDQIQELRGFVKCPNCGEYVEKTETTCPNCGQSLLPEGAVVCPGCGAVITDPDVVFCQFCGARLDAQPEPEPEPEDTLEPGEIRCKCGAILGKNDLFCSKCGTSRAELEQAQAAAPEQAQAAAPEQAQAAEPEQAQAQEPTQSDDSGQQET